MRHNVTPLEVVLRRDRLIVLAGLTAVAVLAWAYMLSLARHMSGMDMGAISMSDTLFTCRPRISLTDRMP